MRAFASVILLVVILPLGRISAERQPVPRHASPSAIVFAGSGLPQPIVLRGMDLSAALLTQLKPGHVAPRDTLRRRHLRVAMFYARSVEWATSPDSVAWAHADLRGHYYAGRGEQPALLLLRPGSLVEGAPRWQGGIVLTDSASAILAAHGIPTR